LAKVLATLDDAKPFDALEVSAHRVRLERLGPRGDPAGATTDGEVK
jgi:hypothetical protein